MATSRLADEKSTSQGVGGRSGWTLKTRRRLVTHHQPLAHANVASKEHSHGVSVEFWEGGGFMKVTSRLTKRNKRKGNKDDGRNSNGSLKQSESISVFVLL